MTTTLASTDAPCSTCPSPGPCIMVTIADEAGDMRRSALSLRTMTAAVCRRCIDAAFTPRHHGRTQWAPCPVTKRGES